MIIGSERRLQESNNDILSVGAASTGNDQGRGPPSLLLPTRTGTPGSILMDHLKQ
jgi:hypothetical protein